MTTTAGERSGTRFHFVGGKGGVGKTTCAAALGLSAARRQRVLVVSTDPAPSLGDAFGVGLASVPRRIPLGRAGELSAVEIDATLALRHWLKPRLAGLEKIAIEGTWLDHEDVTRLLRLSLPGVDELASLLELDRLAATGRYDLIVVDTAPTGHTLRMLSMPETLYGLAVVFDRMRERQRVVEAAFRGAARRNAADAVIEDLAARARALAAMLREPARTTLSWVTLAETMALTESADAIAALRCAGIPVHSIIANRLTPAFRSPCGHCAARRSLEQRALRGLPQVPALYGATDRRPEPRGVAALRRIAAELQAEFSVPARSGRARRWWASMTGMPERPAGLVAEGTRLVLFGGKGGVGKTTCAATLAVSAATSRPGQRVLLISTDPAHSLGDVFGAAVSDLAGPVAGGPPNLDVREIDTARAFTRIRERYAETIEQMFDRMTGSGSLDAAHDRAVMRGLIDLAPPGLDELMSILEITDAIAGDRPSWDLVVMDTAPTGHALRLLEMPGLVQQWVRALMAILLKYRSVVPLGEFGKILLNITRGVGRLEGLLHDPDRARFIAVTRAASLPRLETVRLARRLAKLRIHLPVVVVNAVGRGECWRCLTENRAERREIAATSRALARAGRVIVVAGRELPPPSGAALLRRWGAASWRRAPRYHQDA